MNRRVRGLGAIAIVWVMGCVPAPPQPVYSVRRSALVPHPQPPLRTGRAPDGDVRFTGYDSTVLVPVRPVETAGANAGLYVARHNVGGSMDIRLTEHTDVAVVGQASLLRGAMAVSTDAARPPRDHESTGIGTEIAHAFVLSPQIQLGVVAGFMHFVVPYFEEGRCIANCTGPGYYSEDGDQDVTIWSLSLLPSYREGRFTAFAGVTWRNHPTNSKFDTETQTQLAYDDAKELRGGPMYTIVNAGLEWAASDTVKLLVEVHQPISDQVVRYGPALGLAASFDLEIPKGPR